MAQRKIRMRTRYANAHLAIEPGKVGLVDQAEAQALVNGGYAVYVGADGADQLPTRDASAGKSGGKPAVKAKTPPAGDAGDAGADGDTIDKILAWVDGDSDRARRALDAENTRGEKARTRLVDALAAIVDPQQ